MNDLKPNAGSFSILFWLVKILWVREFYYQIRLIFASCCILISIGLNLLCPLFFKLIVDKLVLILKTEARASELIILLLAYGTCWSCSKVIVQFGEILIFRVCSRGIRIFSSLIFDHLINLSARFHLNRATGAVTEAVFRAQSGMADIFWGLFFSIIPLIIEIVLAIGIIGKFFGPLYAIVFSAIFGLYIFFSYLGIEWFSMAQDHLNSIKMRTGAKIVDSLLNYETVKVFNNTEHEMARASEVFKLQEQAYTNFYWRVDVVHAVQGLIIGIGLTILTFMSGRQVLLGQFSIGDFAMLNGYLLQFVSPLSYLGKVLKDVRKGINDTKNTVELLRIKPEICDRPNAQVLDAKNPRLEFRDVSFGYESDRMILKNVSFVLEQGQTLALVGMTGSGKSTIARLLYRFYDVFSGDIFINEFNLRDLTQRSLQKTIGIVPQDTVLFNDTLLYNVAYGDLTASKERIEDAIKRAHLKKFIQSMPDGLQTRVGERGLKLSGGEKQRIAIARVILKQPSIYIFDEATSALDTKTEQKIYQNLREISKNCTTVIIAHRLSTVVHADKILVLERGQVIESGNHKELLELDGVYKKLYQQQASGNFSGAQDEDE